MIPLRDQRATLSSAKGFRHCRCRSQFAQKMRSGALGIARRSVSSPIVSNGASIPVSVPHQRRPAVVRAAGASAPSQRLLGAPLVQSATLAWKNRIDVGSTCTGWRGDIYSRLLDLGQHPRPCRHKLAATFSSNASTPCTSPHHSAEIEDGPACPCSGSRPRAGKPLLLFCSSTVSPAVATSCFLVIARGNSLDSRQSFNLDAALCGVRRGNGQGIFLLFAGELEDDWGFAGCKKPICYRAPSMWLLPKE